MKTRKNDRWGWDVEGFGTTYPFTSAEHLEMVQNFTKDELVADLVKRTGLTKTKVRSFSKDGIAAIIAGMDNYDADMQIIESARTRMNGKLEMTPALVEAIERGRKVTKRVVTSWEK
jgi:hypothetical protein